MRPPVWHGQVRCMGGVDGGVDAASGVAWAGALHAEGFIAPPRLDRPIIAGCIHSQSHAIPALCHCEIPPLRYFWVMCCITRLVCLCSWCTLHAKTSVRSRRARSPCTAL